MKPHARVSQPVTRFLPSRDPHPVQLGRALLDTFLDIRGREFEHPEQLAARFLAQLERHCIAIVTRVEP